MTLIPPFKSKPLFNSFPFASLYEVIPKIEIFPIESRYSDSSLSFREKYSGLLVGTFDSAKVLALFSILFVMKVNDS